MNSIRQKKISKFLSYILRHKPDSIGITIHKNGWASVQEIIDKAPEKNAMTLEEIQYVVENQNPEKRRLTLSEDLSEIKAISGHSINVELDMEEVNPPTLLYHGTSESNLKSILKNGLTPQKRHHVHMSNDIETAKIVANRRSGKKVILKIEAMKMRASGYKIYFLNNIYFTNKVNPGFISIVEEYC